MTPSAFPEGLILYLDFQGPDGIFADEIRRLGSYRAWAATWPYLRDPWIARIGRNRHHHSRMQFLRRWLDQPDLAPSAMLAFELYPWHSSRVTATMRPDPGTLREFVLDLIAASGVGIIFAFGAVWLDLLRSLPDVTVEARLGAGGVSYGSRVDSRSVLIGSTRVGTVIVAEKPSGSAGPPSAEETRILRQAVDELLPSNAPRP